MKTTFHYLLLLLPLVLFTACNDDDKKTSNPVDQLPPATQTGKNTFGCLINGEPFIVTNTLRMTAIYQGGVLQLGANYIKANVDRQVIIWLEDNITKNTYALNKNPLNTAFYGDFISGCKEYQTYNQSSGAMVIDYIDTNKYIISGTFEFKAVSETCEDTINITNGRFDMQYIP